ncbi:MAG: transposase [Candidatus Omnitrophica bacterium]|nr:transposase [Candidatus Omnitrophota bacterium]
MYLEILKKYKQQYGFKLFSFCLLPEELNLLIELKDGTTISMIMHDITSSYTKYFNARYQRKGHLFRERFKSVVIEKDPYLLSLIHYIHTKPKRLGLEYIFSSELLYLYNQEISDEKIEAIRNILNLEEEIKEVLELINKVFPEKKHYLECVSMITEEELGLLEEKLKRGGLLGSKEFIENVKTQINQRKKEAEREKPLVKPAMVFSGIILLGGVVLALIYVEKNIAVKEKQIYEVLKTKTAPIFDAKQEQTTPQVMDLNGTAWIIKVNPEGSKEITLDEIRFNEGKISSKLLLAEGYLSSNYSLTIKPDGTLVWETMQRNAKGEMVFWRGEEKDGKMEGVFSKRSLEGVLKNFSFVSTGYRRSP